MLRKTNKQIKIERTLSKQFNTQKFSFKKEDGEKLVREKYQI